MNKFKYISIAILLFCSVAATPIKDLVLQSDMQAGGYDINNVGNLSATNNITIAGADVATESYVDSAVIPDTALDNRPATNLIDMAQFGIDNVADMSNGVAHIAMYDSGAVIVNEGFNSNASFTVRGGSGSTILSATASNARATLGSHTSADTFSRPIVDPVTLFGDTELRGELYTDSIQFSGGDADQGILSWNDEEETLDLRENGTTLQLGQELHIHVRNSTGSTISNGTVVAFAGTLGASNRILAEPYLADGNTDLHLILGVATEDILDSEDGKVAHFGKVRDIDTSAFNDGDELYASSTVAGGFTTNAPSAPAQAVVIAFVVNSHAINGTIEVIPNWADENFSSGPATAWSDEGAILRSTNDTVLVSGSGIGANEYQFAVSNDVNGVLMAVDEDGDLISRKGIYNKEPNTSGDESGMAFVTGYDTRFYTLAREYIRMEASPFPNSMVFNGGKRDNDLYIYSDINADTPFFLQGSDGAICIHTNAPQSGYGFTVATNAYIHGEVEMFDNLKVQGEFNASAIMYADTDNSALIVGDDVLDGGGDYGLEVQTPALFNSADLVSAIVIEDVMKLEPRASAPASGVEAGMIFYHSTSNKLFCFDGTVWNALF